MTELRIAKNATTLVIKTVTLEPRGNGWCYITDITVPLGTATAKVYQDAGNTILQGVVVSAPTFDVSILASYPIVEVNGVPATLTRAPSGGHFAGVVSVTLTGTPSPVTAAVRLPDESLGASHRCMVTVL